MRRTKSRACERSPPATLMVPSRFSAACETSISVLSTRETISSARRRRRMPSGVNAILRPLRSRSGTPISASRSAIWRDSVGCVMWRRLAAFVMLSSRATMRKYFNTRISMEIAPFMKSFFSLYHGKERGFRVQVDGFGGVVQRKIYIIETQQVLRIT